MQYTGKVWAHGKFFEIVNIQVHNGVAINNMYFTVLEDLEKTVYQKVFWNKKDYYLKKYRR